MYRIGKYQIIKKIGSGGMATVYLVRDDLTGMKMAMKLLYDHYAEDDHIRKRFLQEARLQLDLNHPNIVRCYNVERVDNRYFILLEYIPGPPLSQVIKKRGQGLRVEEIIPIFTQILSGMEYAHQKGVIHRDIKPMNILLSEYSGYFQGHEIAKISDFGIAKALDQEGHTRTGAQLGSPYFMSPEQIQNAAGVDHRSDIYSLGVLLYQLATGKLPYSPTNNPIKLMEEIVKDPIIDPRIFNRNIPNWLVEIIYKATNKNLKERFQTCSQFLNAIYTYSNLPKQTNYISINKTSPGINNRPSNSLEEQKGGPKSEVKIGSKQFNWIPLILGVFVIGFLLASIALWQLKGNLSLKEYAGKPVENARQELLNNGYKVLTEFAYRDNVSAGQVFNLEFIDNSKSVVRLWVSKGPRHIYLPNFIGQNAYAVISYLNKQGLQVDLRKIDSPGYESGIILNTSPSANTLCRNGEKVTLTIGYNPETPLKDELKFSKDAIKYLKNNKLIIAKTLMENTFSNPKSNYELFTSLRTNIINIIIENGQLFISKKRTKSLVVYYFPLSLHKKNTGIIARIDILNNSGLSNATRSGVSLKYEDSYLTSLYFNTINHNLILSKIRGGEMLKWEKYSLQFPLLKKRNILIIELIKSKNKIAFFINGEKQVETNLFLSKGLLKIGILLPEEKTTIGIDNILIDEVI